MNVLTLPQPAATLTVIPRPCDCDCPGHAAIDPNNSHWEECSSRRKVLSVVPVDEPRPDLVGQQIAIAADETERCRHCLRSIKRHAGRQADSWNHDIAGSLLHRCQGSVPHYGYDAAPFDGQPCNCYACQTWGARPWDGTGPLPLGVIVGSATVEACGPITTQEAVESDTEPLDWLVKVYDGGAAQRIPRGIRGISDQLPFGDFTPGRHALILGDAKPTTERDPIPWTSPGGQLAEWTP